MNPTDTAFLKAITTIKSISRGPNALGKPPLERKVQLYGMYKQATEGDVEGIMPRPEGSDLQTRANQMKWDAWKQQQGKSKQEAKLLYVRYLLETMRSLAPRGDPSELPPQCAELEEIYLRARNAPSEADAGPASARSSAPHSASHSRRLSVGSVNSTYSHFLRNNTFGSPRNATFSEFGLSEKDRSDLQADQLVGQLQSAYPPVIPGAVVPPPILPYESNAWPHAQPVGSKPSEFPSGNGAEPQPHWIKIAWWKSYSYVSNLLEGLLKRFVVDTVTVVSVLIILRVLASRPQVLQKSKVLQTIFKTLVKINVVILDGFGVEVKLKTPSPVAANRALHR